MGSYWAITTHHLSNRGRASFSSHASIHRAVQALRASLSQRRMGSAPSLARTDGTVTSYQYRPCVEADVRSVPLTMPFGVSAVQCGERVRIWVDTYRRSLIHILDARLIFARRESFWIRPESP